jgi:SAM-dependent methyltransferase
MLVSPEQGHRLWAASYDANPNPLLALESRVLQDLMLVAAPMRVVDVACGTGRWTGWFADLGASVMGIDASEEMLARVPDRLHGSLALGRAEALPVASNYADLVLCSFAAGYFSALRQAIAEMARITRSGGRVIVSDLHPAAVAAGWKRSFRADGRVYEIDHARYSLDEITGSAERAGLRLTAEVNVYFDEPERAIFERAGRADRFSEVVNVPAVWAGIWGKA